MKFIFTIISLIFIITFCTLIFADNSKIQNISLFILLLDEMSILVIVSNRLEKL